MRNENDSPGSSYSLSCWGFLAPRWGAMEELTAASKDAVLTQQLQQDFRNRLEFRNVAVAVDDRVALLQGSVETYREKMDAEHLARKHHGIEGVRDYIAVQPIVPVSDQELRETIANRLRYDRIGYGSHSTISK